MGEGLIVRRGGGAKGQYVWKKYTAEGGEFVDYVVSNNASKYPDGGTQDGYWYEKVEEGVDLSAIGITKSSTLTFTYASNTLNPITFTHNLGVIPQFICIKATDETQILSQYGNPTRVYRVLSEVSLTKGTSIRGTEYYYSTTHNTSTSDTKFSDINENSFKFNSIDDIRMYFQGGAEYQIIVMG